MRATTPADVRDLFDESAPEEIGADIAGVNPKRTVVGSRDSMYDWKLPTLTWPRKH